MLLIAVAGMMPGITGLSTPSSCNAFDEIEVVVGVEEELRDREVGLGQLLRGPRAIRRETRRLRMRFGERGHTDREVAHLPHEPHEIDRVIELTRREILVLRRIATEGQDVLDARVSIPGRDLDQLGACGTRR